MKYRLVLPPNPVKTFATFSMIYVCLVYLLLKVNSCENEINNLLHALKRLRKVVALSLYVSSSLLALAIVKWRQNGFSQSMGTCLRCKVKM